VSTLTLTFRLASRRVATRCDVRRRDTTRRGEPRRLIPTLERNGREVHGGVDSPDVVCVSTRTPSGHRQRDNKTGSPLSRVRHTHFAVRASERANERMNARTPTNGAVRWGAAAAAAAACRRDDGRARRRSRGAVRRRGGAARRAARIGIARDRRGFCSVAREESRENRPLKSRRRAPGCGVRRRGNPSAGSPAARGAPPPPPPPPPRHAPTATMAPLFASSSSRRHDYHYGIYGA